MIVEKHKEKFKGKIFNMSLSLPSAMYIYIYTYIFFDMGSQYSAQGVLKLLSSRKSASTFTVTGTI